MAGGASWTTVTGIADCSRVGRAATASTALSYTATTKPGQPGFFVPATATMAGTRATTGFVRIEGKRHPILSGNNAHIKNHAGL
jgi:hypothetical protein